MGFGWRKFFSVRSLALCLVWFGVFQGCAARAQKLDQIIEPEAIEAGFVDLRERLAKDGLEETILEPFEPGRIEFRADVIKTKMLSIVRPMAERSPTRGEISRGKQFLENHRRLLEASYKETGVAPTLVASISWIETNYGRYLGQFPVMESVASLALLDLPQFQEVVAETSRAQAKYESETIKERDDDWKEADWLGRTREVGARWYGELKAFLILAHKLNWDADKIKGSWAGAIGNGQFLPSTALKYMGKRDYDLWKWDDMLPLMARELAEIGWKENASQKEKEEAIEKYNTPKAYRNAVLNMKTHLETHTD